MRRRALLLAALVTAFGPPAMARDPGGLLGSITPRLEQPAGGVEVSGRVAPGPGGGELIVVLRPHGAARLLGEPGIRVTPRSAPGVAWTAPVPLEAQLEGGGYFDGPPELRLPFRGRPGSALEAQVEYSYCLVDYQCLFGETMLAVELPPAG
ncbi:hypothetical protein SH611_02920 [Geminicoccaceae bacterium 1502E]|nr:hypothetical protein [Geminicoccaceae bacterium 1502E]